MRHNKYLIAFLALAVVIAVIAGIYLSRGSARQPGASPGATLAGTAIAPASTSSPSPTPTSEPIFILAKTDVYLRDQTKTAAAALALQVQVTATTTATATQISTQTATATAQATPTAQPAPTGTLVTSSTDTPSPTDTPAPSPTNTLTPTPTTTFTPTPVLGSISGRVAFQGTPAGADLVLSLEDHQSSEIEVKNLNGDGTFTFAGLPASAQGYQIVFAQERNEQYGNEQVLSWALIGLIPLGVGDHLQLPDLDISTLGFSQLSPGADSTFYAYAITPETPILFTWSGYPGATSYWVDLAQGDEQVLVWQSSTTAMTAAAFDGTLADGTHIPPVEYWWAVGAQGSAGAYPLAIYGYLWRFVVNP